MATKKRKKAKQKTRPSRRVSRVRTPKKRKVKSHAKRRVSKPAKPRQRKRSTRKHRPASKRNRPARKPSKPHRRKAAKHREPLRPPVKRAKKGKRSAESKRIERLERELRQTRETLRDITRKPARVRRVQGEIEEEEGGTYAPPRGAIERTDSAGNIVYELPEYTGSTFDDIDWTDHDFDDAYDLVGDEEEDSYGEDAT